MGSAPKGTRDPPEGQLSRAQRGSRGAPPASGTRAQRARGLRGVLPPRPPREEVCGEEGGTERAECTESVPPDQQLAKCPPHPSKRTAGTWSRPFGFQRVGAAGLQPRREGGLERTPAPAQTGLGRSICGGKKRALGGSFAFPAKVGSGHRATPLGYGKFL